MSGCCDPGGHDAMFGPRFARQRERRYRRRGLDSTEREIVSFLRDQGIEGATVLEIGGGIGEIQLELLRHGAARTTNLELASSYDAPARRLADDAGLTDRMERHVLDLAEEPDAVPMADIVVLHRVVCCYPDHARLLTAAAGRTRRLLVFSHPPRNLFSRAVVAAENTVFRARGRAFRTWAHAPDAMLAALAAGGLTLAHQHRGVAWHVEGLVRPDGPGGLV